MKNIITLFFVLFAFAVAATAQKSSFYKIDKVVEQVGRRTAEREYDINGGIIFRGDSVTVNIPSLQFNTFPAANCSFERDENGQAVRYQVGIYCNPTRMVAVEKWVAVSCSNDMVFIRQWGRKIYLKDPASTK